jgi:ferredoxin
VSDDDWCERRISGLTIAIDRTVCIGSGSCRRVAPEVFDLDSGQIIDFLPDAPDIDRARLIEACRVCPVEALTAIGPDGEPLAP